MEFVLSDDDLRYLRSTLQSNDETHQIRGDITAKLNSSVADFNIIVDSWPNYKALVVTINPTSDMRSKYMSRLVRIHDRDNTALNPLLLTTIDWLNKLRIQYVTLTSMEEVIKILREKQRSFYVEEFWHLSIKRELLVKSSIPEGFTLAPLREDQVALVNRNWRLNTGEASEDYFRYLVKRLPSVCLYNESGEVVGYALMYHYGDLGLLNVLKGHEGKGYAKVIMSNLAHLCLNTTSEVFVAIHKENVVSLKLHKKIGFRHVYDSWSIYTIDHEDDNKTTKIRGEIKAKLGCIVTDYEFIVDSWPDYKALVARMNPLRAKYCNYLGPEISVYAKDNNVLESLLLTPSVINWSKFLAFVCLDYETRSTILSAASKQGAVFEEEVYNLMTVTKDRLRLRNVPEGFTIKRLEKEQALLVNQTWKLSTGNDSAVYIEDMIEKLPSCCLYDTRGEVVGFALRYHYGAIGMLYVFEQHRGKGYAKVIMSHLAHSCLENDDEIFVLLEEKNIATIKVHENIGFYCCEEHRRFCLLVNG